MKNSFFKLMVIPLFIFSSCATAMKRPATDSDTGSDQKQLDWEHDDKRHKTGTPSLTLTPCPGLFPELDDIPDFWPADSLAPASSVPLLASPEAASSAAFAAATQEESPQLMLPDEPTYWQQNRSLSPQPSTSSVPFIMAPPQAACPSTAARSSRPTIKYRTAQRKISKHSSCKITMIPGLQKHVDEGLMQGISFSAISRSWNAKQTDPDKRISRTPISDHQFKTGIGLIPLGSSGYQFRTGIGLKSLLPPRQKRSSSKAAAAKCALALSSAAHAPLKSEVLS